MKIDNIKTGLKRATAVVLATLSMCPSINATKYRECEEEEESGSIVITVISFGVGMYAGLVGGSILGNNIVRILKSGKRKVESDKNKDTLPEIVGKNYKDYRRKIQNKDEIALIDATYNYLKYSFENAYVKLEKVSEEITDEELNEIFKKSVEYKYFGELKSVNQNELKKHFKEKYGNDKDNSYVYTTQLSYANRFLVEAVGPSSNCELVQEFVKKL